MHRLVRIAALALLALALLAPRGAAAQGGSQFFPETGHTVGGRFLEYWQQNGGLAVFGFPLSPQFSENGLQVQYFERQRFELHPENARPYDVLLGRLGAQLWGPLPAPADSGPRSGCIWFPETSQNVCNQQRALGFASYWQQNGLEFDGRAGKTYQESLALFGFPITGAVEYTSPDGKRVQAQWFERARFEWHPDNPDQFKVLLGRLGADLAPASPPPAPTVDTVNIYLIQTGGGAIGCGDSAVAVQRRVAPTTTPLRAALTELFSLKTQGYGESGLYNALYQSDVRIDRVVIEGGVATVQLSGTVRINGVCDKPRVIAQIEQTVRQFPTVTGATITLNGASLADAIN